MLSIRNFHWRSLRLTCGVVRFDNYPILEQLDVTYLMLEGGHSNPAFHL